MIKGTNHFHLDPTRLVDNLDPSPLPPLLPPPPSLTSIHHPDSQLDRPLVRRKSPIGRQKPLFRQPRHPIDRRARRAVPPLLLAPGQAAQRYIAEIRQLSRDADDRIAQGRVNVVRGPDGGAAVCAQVDPVLGWTGESGAGWALGCYLDRVHGGDGG